MSALLLWLPYVVLLCVALGLHIRRRRLREARSIATLKEAVESGMAEPLSLHPVVDPTLCMGSGACVRACPESTIGIVNGKAHLVNPSVCIGHGACAAACPVEAIKLVFGTERRGIDIPFVSPTFETNVPGIFIAGELGGMGLVRKAAEQGQQAIASIARRPADPGQLDVVVVGAGPAGLAASLAAMDRKFRFAMLEQEDSLGGTVYHYPRNKIVMTQPIRLPIVGNAKLGEISKESLLKFWQDIVDRVGIPIQFGQRVETITPVDDGFVVKAGHADYRTRSVLLAVGRRGTPRKLDVKGEDLPKVVYRLVDPEQYQGRHILVVGGGDSAIEAAVATASEPGTRVTLSYRGAAFARIKQKNREALAAAEATDGVRVMLESTVAEISEHHAVIQSGGTARTIDNDAVIVCAGGVLPTAMLREIGILVETKFGSA